MERKVIEKEKQPGDPEPMRVPGAEIKLVRSVKIDVFNNGDVVVSNFPGDFRFSLEILTRATEKVTEWFMDASKEGRLDNKKRVIAEYADN